MKPAGATVTQQEPMGDNKGQWEATGGNGSHYGFGICLPTVSGSGALRAHKLQWVITGANGWPIGFGICLPIDSGAGTKHGQLGDNSLSELLKLWI